MTLARRISRFLGADPGLRARYLRYGWRWLSGNALFGALGWLVNRPRSMMLVSYRPDFDYDFGRLPQFAALRSAWLHGNRVNNAGDLARMYTLYLNARRVLEEGVDGAFVELGVYKGNSAKVLLSLCEEFGRDLVLYDTFSGFAQGDLQGIDSRSQASTFDDTSEAAVREFLASDRARLVAGRFPDSLASNPVPESIAVAHVDCDLYAPTKAALDAFYPKLSPGGAFFVHDYFSGYWPGVRQAVDEFLVDHPERLVLVADKSGTAMFRKSG
jgi:hypothetical protein